MDLEIAWIGSIGVFLLALAFSSWKLYFSPKSKDKWPRGR